MADQRTMTDGRRVYVLGFAIFAGLRVVLCEKNKPAYLAGKYNGLGGKVLPEEHTKDAMEREFLEEAGLTVRDWVDFGRIEAKDYTVICYYSYLLDDAATMLNPATDSGERIALHSMRGLSWQVDVCARILLEGLNEMLGAGTIRYVTIDLRRQADQPTEGPAA